MAIVQRVKDRNRHLGLLVPKLIGATQVDERVAGNARIGGDYPKRGKRGKRRRNGMRGGVHIMDKHFGTQKDGDLWKMKTRLIGHRDLFMHDH